VAVPPPDRCAGGRPGSLLRDGRDSLRGTGEPPQVLGEPLGRAAAVEGEDGPTRIAPVGRREDREPNAAAHLAVRGVIDERDWLAVGQHVVPGQAPAAPREPGIEVFGLRRQPVVVRVVPAQECLAVAVGCERDEKRPA